MPLCEKDWRKFEALGSDEEMLDRLARQAAERVEANARAFFGGRLGAFADVLKARDARVKLEAAGLKTYTQVAETKDGKRIRVRVGPFASRADADKAAGKIKTLGLPAAVLTL